MSEVTRTVLPDGSEIWHLGKFEDIVFDDEPINIFEEINEELNPTRAYRKPLTPEDLKRRKEWKARRMDLAVQAVQGATKK